MQTIKTMTPERAEQIKAREIDFSDIPEVTDLEGFSFRNKKMNKVVSVTLEMDNFEWLTSKGISC